MAYRRRWKIERTISWISGFRRLTVSHEYYRHLYQGFSHLACIMICLRSL
jgi:transposase